jgi:peptidoglycan/LPS O-acetylase OafA/YrhL
MIPGPGDFQNSRHRDDIDGLRAIAVLLVIAFHMQAGLLPTSPSHWIGKHISNTLAFCLAAGPMGGFVGVDIFFVISGFLIGGIILREQSAGTFSIIKFYERRIRRIFPALVAVLLFVSVIGYFALTPPELVNLAKSLLAATFSGANIYFWRNSSYFAEPSLLEPLLHTWSLAVEEQFYLVFPLLLLLLHRFLRNHLKLAIVLLTLSSFVASVIGTHHDPTGTFYLAHTRAWELLLGTLVALGVVRPPTSNRSRNIVASAGLALIAIAAFFYTSATMFPGAAALPPCLGAAMIIAAGINGSSLVGRLLSAKPAVFLGLISYSLYLWHWPLLLINRYEYFPDVQVSKPLLFLIMLIAATLSWRFVEQPFRAGSLRLPRHQLFAAAAAATIVLSALSITAIRYQGFPRRFTTEELSLADYLLNGAAHSQWGGGCFAYTDYPFDSSCLADSSSQTNYLLFGDSHAAHLWYGLTTAFPEIHFPEATVSSCKPLLTNLISGDPICKQLVDTVFHHYLPSHHVEAVILSALWNQDDVHDLGQTVAYLHAAKLRVYVVGPVVLYDQSLPDLLIKSLRTHDMTYPRRHLLRSNTEYEFLDRSLADSALKNGATRFLSLREIVCPGDVCLEYVSPGIPLQFDSSHLTNAGSLLVAQRLRNSQLLP